MIKNFFNYFKKNGGDESQVTEQHVVSDKVVDEHLLGIKPDSLIDPMQSSEWLKFNDDDKHISVVPRNSGSELSPFDFVNCSRDTQIKFGLVPASHIIPEVIKHIYDLDKGDCIGRNVQWDEKNNYMTQDMRLKDIVIWQMDRFKTALQTNRNEKGFYIFETTEEDAENSGYWIIRKNGNAMYFYFTKGAKIGSHTFVTLRNEDGYHIAITQSPIIKNKAVYTNQFSGMGDITKESLEGADSAETFCIHEQWLVEKHRIPIESNEN